MSIPLENLHLKGDIALAIFNAMRGKCQCKICSSTKGLLKITDPKLKMDAIRNIVTLALKEPSNCGLGQFFKLNYPIMENWIKSNQPVKK